MALELYCADLLTVPAGTSDSDLIAAVSLSSEFLALLRLGLHARENGMQSAPHRSSQDTKTFP